MHRLRTTLTAALALGVLPLTMASECGAPSSGSSSSSQPAATAALGAGAPTDAANPDGCDAGLRPATTGLKVGATLYATVWTRCINPPKLHLLTVTLYQVIGSKDYKKITSQVYTRTPPEVPLYNLLTWPCVPGTYIVTGDIEGTWSNGQDFAGVHVEGKPVVVNPDDCQ